MPMDTARKCAISSSVSHGFQVEPPPPDIDRSSLGLVADRVGSPSAVRANTFRKTVGDGRRHVVRHRASEAREPHLLQRVVIHDRACRLSVNGLKPAQGYTRWFSCRTTVLPSTATAVTLSYSGGVPVWPGYGWWRSVNASGAGTLPGSRETPVRGDGPESTGISARRDHRSSLSRSIRTRYPGRVRCCRRYTPRTPSRDRGRDGRSERWFRPGVVRLHLSHSPPAWIFPKRAFSFPRPGW